MNCPSCGTVMRGDLCDCGWQKPITRPMPTQALSEPTNTLGQVERHAKELGIADDPAKAKELFLTFKRKGGMANLVPTEDEEEARKEREAIQSEGK